MAAEIEFLPEEPKPTDRQIRNLCALHGLKATRRKNIWTVVDTKLNRQVGKTDTSRTWISWMETLADWSRKRAELLEKTWPPLPK